MGIRCSALTNIAAYYDKLAIENGISPRTSDANSQKSLEARWKVLSEVCDLRGKSVLEVGCGYGGFPRYLQKKITYLNSYTGIDISQKAIRASEKEGKFRFNLIHADAFDWTEKADVVLSQGPFYLADEQYAYKLIDKMWNLANEAVAFTGISTWCDVKDDYYRIDPAKMLNYLRKYTDKIVMRHDYWRGDCCFFMMKEKQGG